MTKHVGGQLTRFIALSRYTQEADHRTRHRRTIHGFHRRCQSTQQGAGEPVIKTTFCQNDGSEKQSARKCNPGCSLDSRTLETENASRMRGRRGKNAPARGDLVSMPTEQSGIFSLTSSAHTMKGASAAGSALQNSRIWRHLNFRHRLLPGEPASSQRRSAVRSRH